MSWFIGSGDIVEQLNASLEEGLQKLRQAEKLFGVPYRLVYRKKGDGFQLTCEPATDKTIKPANDPAGAR